MVRKFENSCVRSLGRVSKNLFSDLYNQLRWYSEFVFGLRAEFHQFSTGYFEIVIPLEDFYAVVSIQEEATLYFYRLKMDAGRYQMREKIKVPVSELPLSLFNLVEQQGDSFTIDSDNLSLNIIATIKGIENAKKPIASLLDYYYNVDLTGNM